MDRPGSSAQPSTRTSPDSVYLPPACHVISLSFRQHLSFSSHAHMFGFLLSRPHYYIKGEGAFRQQVNTFLPSWSSPFKLIRKISLEKRRQLRSADEIPTTTFLTLRTSWPTFLVVSHPYFRHPSFLGFTPARSHGRLPSSQSRLMFEDVGCPHP